MKIYVVVKYTDVPAYGMSGEAGLLTETEIIEAYNNEQDAKFERKYLNDRLTAEEYNVLYDVVVVELN